MTDVAPIPIVAHGFSWAAAGSWLSGVSLLGIIGLIIRHIGPWRRQTTEAETRLREELENRVKLLEQRLDEQQVNHEAEKALARHQIANLNQVFDAVILMLETAPDKTAEVLSRVKEMRERQLAAEAIEKATIHAAKIEAVEKRHHDPA